ncbi:hypothetical protein TVAG_088070 [Trichomonas vaginalis G3]|uniref:Uncharacterized protein n=1 Tax=Trichomonas vaginalis (strain ATCC PRA-98 / G3) TaxID=412133 RepID=A2F5J9_TRIV3|nr:WD40 repeat-like family [Trichomonas vaginalis G3]EAX99825.1 hypothetical protein TVAG_088070 [Trichomonas vaginalis G3]KAI5517808.1 WD40 repeat-like family [Trichomonas vaginalis G3]|eukprot:XP_001312755.1 hypothetical protein [Trichomonas vaginalis G3]
MYVRVYKVLEKMNDIRNRRCVSANNDEILFDPLPQPYRFISKILVQTIEEAINLAEDGGSTEAQNAFVCHNLRLTKVGKIPITSLQNYVTSTELTENEISIYQIYANTKNIMIGTTAGTIHIYNPESKQQMLTINVSAISKFAQGPISHLFSFETDYENNIIVFACDESAFIIFVSNNFQIRGTFEIDISSYHFDTMTITRSSDFYITITDGNGRCSVYDCHSPQEFQTQESGAAKTAAVKALNLEPVFEIEKCLLTNQPVNSEQSTTIKLEDPTTKKKNARKSKAAPTKAVKRNKSPSNLTAEAIAPIQITHYNATVFIHENLLLIYFESFQVLLLFQLTPTLQQVSDFLLPSKVMCVCEVDKGIVAFGFENGSFCILNIKRKAISAHTFQKRGAITKMKAIKNTIFTITTSRNITAYNFDGKKVTGEIFSISDEDIVDMISTESNLITTVGRPSDAGLCTYFSKKLEFSSLELELIPNVSFLNPDGKYIGTVRTPANIEQVDFVWSNNFAIFVYKDPKEYLVPATKTPPPTHGKKGMSPKNAKQPPSKKPTTKSLKDSKKVEEVKEEQEPMVVMRREIIGYMSIEDVRNEFIESLISNDKTAQERRNLIKSKSSKSVENLPVEQQ